MKRETAVAAMAHCDEAVHELEKMLFVLQSQCPRDEYVRHRRTIAGVLVSLTDVARPIYQEYPELDVHGITLPVPKPDDS